MAKPIVVSLRGADSSFQLQKLERSKLYGSKRRLPLDPQGQPCTRAALTDDGEVLLLSGMTAQGWFDDCGRQVEASELGAQGTDGVVLEPVPSTLGVSQPLEGPVSPLEVLDLAITSVYELSVDSVATELADSLARGEIWRFRFNYRPDFMAETAFLLANDAGTFALIGQPAPAPHLPPNAPPPPDGADDVDGDDVDFEML